MVKYFKETIVAQQLYRKGISMPPKNKFTKEEIIEACLYLVREEGKSAVTARAVASRLKSSPKVIFGLFDSMEELNKAIVIAAEETFVRQVEIALREEKAFRAVGIAYIRFAAEEPQLFQLIFMNESERAIHQFSEFLPIKDYSYEKMILSIQEEYGLSRQLSEQLYQHLFIYSHGIASMTAAGIYRFSPAELTSMLTQVFTALIKELLGGNHD